MAFPVVTLDIVDHVPRIAQILLDYQHNGFPVIRKNREGKKVFYGLITRFEHTKNEMIIAKVIYRLHFIYVHINLVSYFLKLV